MDKSGLTPFISKTESMFRMSLQKSLKDAQNMPEMMKGLMVWSAAGILCQDLKNDYPRFQSEIKNLNLVISEKEYSLIIDDITTKVLKEFVDIPDN
jgi:hypothetical protein